MPGLFVDCHSHAVPSGDDGVSTVEEAVSLCRQAAARGTRVLFATPHVWPHLPLSEERERAIRAAHAEAAAQVPLELRLGFELTPAEALLDEDPRRYALEGTSFVLIELPFSGPPDLLVACADHIAAAGLRPLIAHPERGEAVLADPALPAALAERGWLLQVNATSLLGRHGPAAQELAWELLESGTAALVASDGHRQARPPFLDEAYTAAERRLGERALRFFDGSALGLASGARPLPSRAAARGA